MQLLAKLCPRFYFYLGVDCSLTHSRLRYLPNLGGCNRSVNRSGNRSGVK